MKGQSSLEFLAYVSLLALVLAGLHSMILSKRVAAGEYSNNLKADRIADYVSFQVEMALVQGEGYSRTFSVPESLAGSKYNVSLVNGTAIVAWHNRTSMRPSRYEGDLLRIRTGDSNVFKAVNTGEVRLVEQ